LLVYLCLSGLGFFFGGFTLLLLVLRVCRHINGAPFSVGEYVTILTGPKTGTVAKVYELTPGQGGGLLPRVDLGAESRAECFDVFSDYELLREPRVGHFDANTAQAPTPGCSMRSGANFWRPFEMARCKNRPSSPPSPSSRGVALR
jgi:hypothetical protein